MHRLTLDSMRLMFGVTASADEIVAAWQKLEQEGLIARTGGVGLPA